MRQERTYSQFFKKLVMTGRLARLNGAAVKVLMVLDAHCNGVWECDVSVRSAARLAGISTSTVRLALCRLSRDGLIEVMPSINPDKPNERDTNHYRIMPTEHSRGVSMIGTGGVATIATGCSDNHDRGCSDLCEKGVAIIATEQIKRTKTDIPATCVADPQEGFSRFWTAYPKKKDRQAALKVWMKLKPDQVLLEKILAAVEAQKTTSDWQKDGGQYIPYPSTWLYRQRWNDVLDTETQASAGGPAFTPRNPTPEELQIAFGEQTA